jgi:hypothetical protein
MQIPWREVTVTELYLCCPANDWYDSLCQEGIDLNPLGWYQAGGSMSVQGDKWGEGASACSGGGTWNTDSSHFKSGLSEKCLL